MGKLISRQINNIGEIIYSKAGANLEGTPNPNFSVEEVKLAEPIIRDISFCEKHKEYNNWADFIMDLELWDHAVAEKELKFDIYYGLVHFVDSSL